jgi:hypothetical protein
MAREQRDRDAWWKRLELTSLVDYAYAALIFAYVLVILALVLGAGLPTRWSHEQWAAFGQIVSAIISAAALVVIAIGLRYQREEMLDARDRTARELAHLEAQLLPNFQTSTLIVGYNRYGEGQDGPQLYEYTMHLKNSGGPADGVRVVLVGAAGHPAALRYAPTHEDIGHVGAGSDIRPFSRYRFIVPEHRTPADEEFPLLFSNWRCGPLVIDYVSSQNVARRSEFELAGTGFGPTAAGSTVGLRLVSDTPLTPGMVTFEDIARQALERATTLDGAPQG